MATRTGGLPEVVDERKTGFLVEPANEIELANAIVKLLKDRDLCDSMGLAGNQKLKNELSPTVACKQTAEVYQLAIADRAEASNRIEPNLSKSIQANIYPP